MSTHVFFPSCSAIGDFNFVSGILGTTCMRIAQGVCRKHAHHISISAPTLLFTLLKPDFLS